ncbi:MAG: Fe-S cluster assembly ATPase SufC [Bdellovibrionales bacterium]|nr:Fe-S cluster assembly ATPase SufC [Bdellovibrionales bacterium]
MVMLEIKDLKVSVDGKQILNGINLSIGQGEVHAIMGPNGSGKSTLSQVLAGRESYHIDSGSILFLGKDLTQFSVEERAGEGVFMAFQYPVAIPGVKNTTFLKAALNSVRKYRGEEELDAAQFLKLLKEKSEMLELRDDLLKRYVNDGFSGGEKKRNEIVQMAVLDPCFAVLDETDSGLDIDALKTVASGVNQLRGPKRSMLVITHYQRLLDYIVPDFVHVLAQGKIITSGGKDLAKELEEKGYGWIQDHEKEQTELPSV